VLARAGLVRAGLARASPVRADRADPPGAPFTCDAIWAGGPDRYVAICGPGSLAANGAHTAAEHLAVADADEFAARIRDAVLAFGEHVRDQPETGTGELAAGRPATAEWSGR